jgi:hypothetical protein
MQGEILIHRFAEAESARKSAWQFIQKTDDPRLSMLVRFAQAMGVDVKELL